MNAPKHLTLRNVPSEVAKSLKREARRRGSSLNQTAVDILRAGLGLATPRSNGLERLAGDWSDEEFQEFEAAIAVSEQVDEELWR